MAVCTQILCDDFHVTMVINTGVAGSLNNALDIGDIVLSSCAQEHDMDVSPLRRPGRHHPTHGTVDFYSG